MNTTMVATSISDTAQIQRLTEFAADVHELVSDLHADLVKLGGDDDE